MLPGDQQVGVHVQMGTCSVAAMAVAEQTLNALNYATVLVNTILKINDANQVVTGTALATDLVHQLQHIRTFAVLGADADESDAAKVYAKTAHAYATAAETVAMTMYRLGVITSKRLLVFNDHIAKINQRLDTWKVALITVNQSQPVVENQPVSR